MIWMCWLTNFWLKIKCVLNVRYIKPKIMSCLKLYKGLIIAKICWMISLKINIIFRIKMVWVLEKVKGTLRQNKKTYISNSRKYLGFINFFYCNQKGHHIKDCCYRNETYVLRPNDKLLWLPKDSTSKSYPLFITKIIGIKTTWVPSSKEWLFLL